MGNGGVPVLEKDQPYETAVVPDQTPPVPLSKEPIPMFTIIDSLKTFQDVKVFCTGGYSMEFGSKGELTLRYLELHQIEGTNNFKLEEVPSETEKFIMKGGKMCDI